MSKILHILASARAEGTPRLVMDWLTLSEHRQGVVLLSDEWPDLEAQFTANAEGVYKGRVKLNEGGRGRRRAAEEVMRRGMDDFKPDVVVCWATWAAGCAGRVIIALDNQPCLIVHCGNPAEQGFVASWRGLVHFWHAYRVNAQFAACSTYVRDSFRRRTRVFKKNFHATPNCTQIVDVAFRAEAARAVRTPGPVRFIMVGTMEGHKDQATLVEAAAVVVRSGRAFELWLAGGGIGLATVQRQVESGGLAGWVKCLGSQSNVPALLGQSDCFVFSTTGQEGFGTVLIEAMSAGLPVIASDVPACREALQDGKWGRLVPPKNKEALAAAMIAFIDDPKRNEADKASVANYLSQFTPAEMAKTYLSLCT